MKEWNLPAHLEPWSAEMLRERLRQGEGDFDGAAFTDLALEEWDFYGVSFTGCRFTRCRFSGAQMGQCSFVEAVLDRCDFSNAEMEESFWQRCELVGCKLVGARLQHARFRQVGFRECVAEYASFDRAGFDRVRMEACGLGSAELRGCKCKELTFLHCGLLHVNVCGTALAGVDVSTSETGGWTLTEGAPEVRGMIVTPAQAVELAERMGLVIREPGAEKR